ncbi:fructokinase [Salinibacterium sp. CAN_S4]|uniref:PfkB family carbohydrate kinase n=1 Tax=Salinibacterium sp. CAN_S4 TaxID=2787727 RepID=UPI0018EFF363
MNAGALVVGEALIDEVLEGDRVSRHVGGSPANVALGLARLGVPTRLHTAIGADEDGQLIRTLLSDSGAALTEESVTDVSTSRATATLAVDGSASYEFTLSWDPRPLDDLGSPTVIHTGSLGAFLEPGNEISADIVRRGRGSGAIVTFDPNIRPSLIRDALTARSRFEALASSSHVTKLSDEDAEFLYPSRSIDFVLDALVDAGVAVVGITRGGHGARLASGAERVTVPPVVTSVADTVGAGDSFMSALIWALIFNGEGWDGQPIPQRRLERIGSIAASAASITVSRPGADLPKLDELIAGGTARA